MDDHITRKSCSLFENKSLRLFLKRNLLSKGIRKKGILGHCRTNSKRSKAFIRLGLTLKEYPLRKKEEGEIVLEGLKKPSLDGTRLIVWQRSIIILEAL
jgi:hypothetical protein